MLSWLIREIKKLSDAIDDYFFGPSQAVLAEQRRVREHKAIETELDRRKEIKAMGSIGYCETSIRFGCFLYQTQRICNGNKEILETIGHV